MIPAIVCFMCKHYKGIRKCKAFKDKKIPTEIWSGKNDHSKRFKGDNGIKFESKKKKK